jgi:Peptidase A4 family
VTGTRLVAAIAGLAVALIAPASAAPAGRRAHGPVAGLHLAVSAGGATAVSTNWSGYAVAGTEGTGAPVSYRAVSGAWVQPAATCTAGKATYAAFWVGLGGFAPGSQALEQIGTSSDCSAAGKAVYSVWYELVPAAAVPLKLKLAAGDSVSAVVVVSGRTVTLRLGNLTRGTVFTKRLTTSAPDVSSAEWIAEAPSECTAGGRCRVLPLTNFGTVTFSRAAAATVGAHAGTISDPTWAATAIELASDPSATATVDDPGGGAVPSDLSPDGSGFTVTWRDGAAAG